MWWLPFAAISLYWALGGMGLVETAVQEYGVQLAHERPAWFVSLVLGTAIVKLGFVLYAYLLVAPVGRRIHRWLYLVFGGVAGAVCLSYGLLHTSTAFPLPDSISTRGWWLLLLWWPQFWVGGLLTLAATAVFWRHSAVRTRR